MVVVPDAMSPRSSGHVSSSRKTVVGGAARAGVASSARTETIAAQALTLSPTALLHTAPSLNPSSETVAGLEAVPMGPPVGEDLGWAPSRAVLCWRRYSTMWILGLSPSHDASAALLHDGIVIAAVAEERLTRIKGDGGRLPRHPSSRSSGSPVSIARKWTALRSCRTASLRTATRGGATQIPSPICEPDGSCSARASARMPCYAASIITPVMPWLR